MTLSTTRAEITFAHAVVGEVAGQNHVAVNLEAASHFESGALEGRPLPVPVSRGAVSLTLSVPVDGFPVELATEWLPVGAFVGRW